jgi:hypothetical protein
VLLALTVLLNVVLTTLIIVKLVGARRAARVFGAVQTASSYSDIIAIVVESALAWVLAICLGVIFNTNGFQNTPIGLLFNSISENISVSWGRRYGVRWADRATAPEPGDAPVLDRAQHELHAFDG